MVPSSELLFSFVLFTFISLIQAVPIDPSTILNQLKRNGACCTALNYFLPGKVFTATDLKYQSSQASFWSAQEQSLLPTCIVIPQSTQDVSTAVSILSVGYQASITGCKFAMRGGGHTPFAGAANINGGVTIDMQSMNSVNISSDQKTVSIGGGNRWGNVYGVLEDKGLMMVGGRVSYVGAPGLITGGGVSFFSGRYGLVCNNIQSYEVVLGNGSVVTASSTTNVLLWRALKGGSNNFGIVTRFVAKTFSQSEYWGGSIGQPITVKDAFFDFFVDFAASASFDPYAALISDFAWIAGVPTLLHNVAYTNGAVAWPPPAYAPLDALPKLSTTMRKGKTSDFTDEIATIAAPTEGHNNLLHTLTFANKGSVSAAFMAQAWDLADAAAVELVSVAGLVFTMTFQPLPQVLYSKNKADVLGLDGGDYINLLFTLSWTLPTDNERVYARMQQLEADLVALMQDVGVYDEFVYLNYAAQWQKPIRSYGPGNVAFLKSVSSMYDPRGIFQNAVPGGFKLDD